MPWLSVVRDGRCVSSQDVAAKETMALPGTHDLARHQKHVSASPSSGIKRRRDPEGSRLERRRVRQRLTLGAYFP